MERWVLEHKLDKAKAAGYEYVMEKGKPIVQFEDEDAKRRYLMDKPEVKIVEKPEKPKRKKK